MSSSGAIDPASPLGKSIVFGTIPRLQPEGTEGEGYDRSVRVRQFSANDTRLILNSLAEVAPPQSAGAAGASSSSAPSAATFMYQLQHLGFCRMHSLNHVFQTIGAPLITLEEHEDAIASQKSAILAHVNRLQKELDEFKKKGIPDTPTGFWRSVEKYIKDELFKTKAIAKLDREVAAGPLNSVAVRRLVTRRGLTMVPLYMNYWPSDDKPAAQAQPATPLSGLPMMDAFERGQRVIDYSDGNYILEGRYPSSQERHAVAVTQNLYIDSNPRKTTQPDIFDPARWVLERNDIREMTGTGANERLKTAVKKYVNGERVSSVDLTRRAMDEGVKVLDNSDIQEVKEQPLRPDVAIIDVDRVGWNATVSVAGRNGTVWTFPLEGLPLEYGLKSYMENGYVTNPYTNKRQRAKLRVLPSLPRGFIVDTVFVVVPAQTLPDVEQLLQGQFLTQQALYNEFRRAVIATIARAFDTARRRSDMDYSVLLIETPATVEFSLPPQYASSLTSIPVVDEQNNVNYDSIFHRHNPLLVDERPWAFGAGQYKKH